MHLSNRVLFERPDLPTLNRDNTVVDLHFHSSYSDGINRIDTIANHARRLGIGVAVTDHNEIRGALEIDQYPEVLSIPGIELTAAEGSHLLVYFYDTAALRHFFDHHVAPFRGQGVMSSLSISMRDCIERARQYDSLVIFPHPYCAVYTGVCNLQFSENQLHALLQMSDGVEAINANSLSKWNLKCAVLGFNLRKTMTGGSDGHALTHMGRAVSYAACPRDRTAFLDALREGSNRVVGKEIPFLTKVTTNSLKFRSNLAICQEMIEKNVRYGCKAFNHKSQCIRSSMRRRLDGSPRAQILRKYFGVSSS